MRTLLVALLLAAPSVAADELAAPSTDADELPVVGTSARVGQGLEGDRPRLGASLYALFPVGSEWGGLRVGGTVDGDGEAFAAGPSCGLGSMGLERSLGVTCVDAGVSVHALAGYQWDHVRFSVGPGASYSATTAGLRDRIDDRWRISAVGRADLRTFLGSGRLGAWYLAAGIEERFQYGSSPRLAATLSFEGLAR